ncbi:MAG: hypothetical protein F6K00_26755 [Leptolyngbya sp. SIOISBB]|nr:hypothetical protein [Leptolyngbya sp. SIOISBB]
MTASVYILHRRNQLDDATAIGRRDEGKIFPLLRLVPGTRKQLTWAFAVPRRNPAADDIEIQRKNLLVAATLKALDFEIDPQNSTQNDFDYYFIKHDNTARLIDDIADGPATFGDTFPTDDIPDPLPDSGIILLPPKGDVLRTVDDAKVDFPVRDDAVFHVDQMDVKKADIADSKGFLTLGPDGDTTIPEFNVVVELDSSVRDAIVAQLATGAPELEFTHVGTTGNLNVNGQRIAPNNKQPISIPEAIGVPKDERYDRLTIDVATLVCLARTEDTEAAQRVSLAVELFPAITILPKQNLPVSISIAQDSLRIRHMPTEGEFKGPPVFCMNHLRPCLRVTVRGPMIHSEKSESTGLSDWLPLLEPAERKFDDAVESFNDFLTYSFEICFPTVDPALLTEFEIDRIEGIRLPVLAFDWWNEQWQLELFKLLLGWFDDFHVAFQLPNFILPSALKLELTLPDYFNLADLPDLEDPELWSIRLLRFGLQPVDLDIASLSLSGFTLTVNLNFSIRGRLPDVAFDTFELRLEVPDLDFNFPDLGLPSLTEFRVPVIGTPSFESFSVQLPDGLDVYLPPLDELRLWALRLKRPDGMSIDLKVDGLELSGLVLTISLVVDLPVLPQPNIDIVELEWKFLLEKLPKVIPELPNLPTFKLLTELPNRPIVKLPELPEIRLPRIPGLPDFDVRLLKVRLRTPEFDLGTFPVLGISPSLREIQFDIPDIDVNYPRLLKLIDKFDVTLELSIDLRLSLNKCFLTDLLGEIPSVDFRFSIPDIRQLPPLPSLRPRSLKLPDVPRIFGRLSTPVIPFELIVRMPHPTLPRPEWDEIKLVIGLKFDLAELRLFSNRIYFFLPQRRGVRTPSAPMQVVDFDIFTLTFPTRPDPLGIPVKNNHDGYFDISQREFVIDLVYEDPNIPEPEPPPALVAFFPGGLKSKLQDLD